jgi:DNA-binding response OmpR family regulator
MTNDTKTVLVVEDEQGLADMYAEALREEYEVAVAYSGEAALDAVDDDIDAVLLDRKMPGLSGREVLERLREDGVDCPVAMLTAVKPDWDVIEMPFDDYLLKPVGMPELHRCVDRLLALAAVPDDVREYVATSVKQAALEGQKDASELEASESFEALTSEAADTGAALGDVTADLSPDQTELIIETITRSLSVEDE